MSFYTIDTDFLDPNSIKENNVDDLVELTKKLIESWNDYVPGYGNYNPQSSLIQDYKHISWNVSKMLKDCQEIIETLTLIQNDTFVQDSLLKEQELLNGISLKWAMRNHYSRNIYQKKITIIQTEKSECERLLKEFKILDEKELKGLTETEKAAIYCPGSCDEPIDYDDLNGYKDTLCYNSCVSHKFYSKSVPFWVKFFEYNFPNFGGDEESFYLKSGWYKITNIKSESAFSIKTRWIALNTLKETILFSIARSAHA